MKHPKLLLSFISLSTPIQSGTFAFYCATAFATPRVQLQKMNTCLCGEKRSLFFFFLFNVLEMLKHIHVNLDRKNFLERTSFQIHCLFLERGRKQKKLVFVLVLLLTGNCFFLSRPLTRNGYFVLTDDTLF